MKSNREFLNGVYAKAELLEREKTKNVKPWRFNFRLASIAAMIILIPTIFFWNSDRGYEELSGPMIIRTIDNPVTYFQEADFIVIGETVKSNDSKYVEEGNYIYTDIVFKLDEVLKGEISEEEIILRVNGGKAKKEKLKSEMESQFIKGEESLVFLMLDENGTYSLINSESKFEKVAEDLFKDKMGNEYKLEEVKNIIMEEEKWKN